MCNLFGGDNSQTVVNRTELPKWLETAAQGAVSSAQQIQNQPYTAFGGERVAPLSANQTAAVNSAQTNQGNWKPFMDSASGHAEASSKPLGMSYSPTDVHTFTWDEGAMNRYMNPFIKGALNPVITDLEERSARDRISRNAASSMRGAFGGSRTAVEDSLADFYTNRNIGNVLSTGYANAYNSALGAFQTDEGRRYGAERANEDARRASVQLNAAIASGDRDAVARAAGQMAQLAASTSELSGQDMQRLLATGALERGVQQQKDDVAYSNFVEERDWPMRGLDAVLRAISATPYPQTSTQTTSGGDSNALGQLLGTGLALYGAFG